ncbi:MAG: hypothetical protein DYG96_04660 [Chlorobi bacterium CHB2]|nr:hypothetical protein [Chlorobi bacterium CHB2]
MNFRAGKDEWRAAADHARRNNTKLFLEAPRQYFCRTTGRRQGQSQSVFRSGGFRHLSHKINHL